MCRPPTRRLKKDFQTETWVSAEIPGKLKVPCFQRYLYGYPADLYSSHSGVACHSLSRCAAPPPPRRRPRAQSNQEITNRRAAQSLRVGQPVGHIPGVRQRRDLVRQRSRDTPVRRPQPRPPSKETGHSQARRAKPEESDSRVEIGVTSTAGRTANRAFKAPRAWGALNIRLRGVRLRGQP